MGSLEHEAQGAYTQPRDVREDSSHGGATRQGKRKPSVLIKRFGLSRTCIYPWIRAAREQGVRALAARPHSGRRPALTLGIG